MRYFLLLSFLILSTLLNAQVLIDSDKYMERLKDITLNEQLPEGLLQGKAVVIHTYPDAAKDYKRNAEKLQPGFAKAGIDAVSHYLFENIFSGKEVMPVYHQQITDRQVDFLIYYIAGREHELIIMPYGKEFFGNTGFYIKNRNLEQLLDNLYLRTARSDQELLNLLILEEPSYPEFPQIIEGRRAEFYDLNMKSGKVAIPATDDTVLNKEIDSVMAAHYPYKYGFVEPGLSEEELRKEGYWFIMYAVHASGKAVRQLLGYEASAETAYASVVENNGETSVTTIDIHKPVYKFYIKHIQSKDIYLGRHYDADEQWDVALKNYIFNLRNILYR